VDENAHAMHFFITALLGLLDRFGHLYGELARFVLRLLGYRRKKEQPKLKAGSEEPGQVNALLSADGSGEPHIEVAADWGGEMAGAPPANPPLWQPPNPAWDNMWRRGMP